MFLSDVTAECLELNVAIEELVKVDINVAPLSELQQGAASRNGTIALQLDSSVSGSLASEVAALQEQIGTLNEQLDAPNQEYQRYVKNLADWEGRRTEIVGTADTLGSITYLEAQLAALDDIPEKLDDSKTRRMSKVKEVFAGVQSLVDMYRTLYRPVQDFIEHHPLANRGFQLDFQVQIVESGFEENFFSFITQQKRGSFCGVEEGRQTLKTIVERTDFNDWTSIATFLNQALDHLAWDFRHKPPTAVPLAEQLKREGTVADFYNFLFAFDYLRPKYNLQWGGRELDELSPGERGTVLLLFYLLLDSANVPLIIDQPEENLDNQTVFNVLVPAIKEARTRRQIVIVTHNPNLAVVCDADQIIYAHLSKSEGNRVTYLSGSIENPIINQKIIDVLEGTRPAFDNRESKYHATSTPN